MDNYQPSKIEKEYYEIWEKKGYFELDSNKDISNGKTFCIMMPPPNITGALHMGHALTYTLQDIVTRYKRMRGFKTLWQPGIDHAGIATQNVVEKRLLAKGIKKEAIGREEFIKEVWRWKEESGFIIISQLKRLGVSPNWSRLRFTMDHGLQNAVKEAFIKWYNNGLIYQDNYMINWCTHDGALSDIEVEYEENEGFLCYIKYFVKDSKSFVVVATTRPETYFGDTAIMVNPNDTRYKHLIGEKVVLPLLNREITIIEDDSVDMDFGTGCVKVTPAHDMNDYEVGKRHNLDSIVVFDKYGILNENCGKFSGLERIESRKLIIDELKNNGFIEKIEPYKNQVGKCYRCGNIVEPYISTQWFVSKDIAKETIIKVNNGEVTFYPTQWINNFNAWMNELRNWCISRQLWWGHRIPIFYCDNCNSKVASKNDIEYCKICNCKMRQDEDVLDTWFSSGLWAFSTLGWGNIENDLFNESDLKDFYPNDLLITSFDILFFWVSRMLFSGENLLSKLPFKDIYLHALVCDEFGKKMSKSKGNVINPLSMIDKYNSDVLRFTLAYYAIQGRDIKIGDKSLDIGNSLHIKILNALNFLIIYKNQQQGDFNKELESINTPLGIYMKSRLQLCINEVCKSIDLYRFNDAASALYKFLFNDFCDWGIEFIKASKDCVFEMGLIFKEAIKLLHPFMPFVSEFVYQSINGTNLQDSKSIMIESFPKQCEFVYDINDFDILKDIITTIRRAKIIIDYANKAIPLSYIKLNKSINIDLIYTFVPKLAKSIKVEIIETKMDNCVFDIGEFCEIYIPTNNIDISNLIDKLNNKKTKILKEIYKLESTLNNPKFISNAPKELIKSNEVALNLAKDKLEKIDLELNVLIR